MESQQIIVTTLKEVEKVIQYCKDTGYCSFDFETNGTAVTEPWFKVTGIGISFQPGSAYFIPLNKDDSPLKHKWWTIMKMIGVELMEHPGIIKIGWNLLFEYRIWLRYGFRVAGRMFDAMLAKYILNEERPNDLKSQVDYYLPRFSGYDLEGKPGKKASPEKIKDFWEGVDIYELGEYCALDADLTFRLFIHFENKLFEHGLYHLFRNYYMPLVRVMGKCILDGVMVDREYLEWLVNDYDRQIKAADKSLREIDVVKDYEEWLIDSRVTAAVEILEDDIEYKELSDRQIRNKQDKIDRLLAGDWRSQKDYKLFEPLNFNSVAQMGGLLYTEEGFNFKVPFKTDTGNPSTSEDALKQLLAQDDSGFVRGLLELRSLQKFQSTYIKPILEDHIGSDGKIHPTYLLHGTVTGRFSSRNPNFQNIPRNTTAEAIKKMFIAPKDHFFVEIDGSQMELRLVAELSKDKAMLETFASNKNIHVNTAVLTTKSTYELIQQARKNENHEQHLWAVKEHKKAKILNFTILYGASKWKVGEFLTDVMNEYVDPEDADGFITDWFEAYPGVKKWIDKTRKIAMKQGYVQSPFGRKRRLPIFLDPKNKFNERGSWNEALRQSCNSIIQGMASDVTQWVNIQIYMATLRGELPNYLRLVSTVHDSNEYYIHKKDMATVIPKMQEIAHDLKDMKKYLGYELKHVSMKFSAEYGINWGMAHEYNQTDFEKEYDDRWDQYNQEEFDHITYS